VVNGCLTPCCLCDKLQPLETRKGVWDRTQQLLEQATKAREQWERAAAVLRGSQGASRGCAEETRAQGEGTREEEGRGGAPSKNTRGGRWDAGVVFWWARERALRRR
jgi:hypothetical protein